MFLIAVMLACVPVSWAAPQKQKQGLQAKLARPADFVPTDKSPLNRLVSIAQHYEIPMGIEWFEGTENLELPATAIPAKATVRDLLTGIVSRLPDYVLTIERGVVHIAPPVIAVRKDNVLNLIINHFEVNNDTMFGAQFNLRVAKLFAKTLRVEAGVENLLDKRYADHLGGVNRVAGGDLAVGERIPGAGRFAYGSVAWEF